MNSRYVRGRRQDVRHRRTAHAPNATVAINNTAL
jgi:hypothetical protein